MTSGKSERSATAARSDRGGLFTGVGLIVALIGVESVILSIPSRYILLVIGVDLRLNFAGHLCLFWEFYRFEEVRVGVGEIYLAHVDTRNFVARQNRTPIG